MLCCVALCGGSKPITEDFLGGNPHPYAQHWQTLFTYTAPKLLFLNSPRISDNLNNLWKVAVVKDWSGSVWIQKSSIDFYHTQGDVAYNACGKVLPETQRMARTRLGSVSRGCHPVTRMGVYRVECWGLESGRTFSTYSAPPIDDSLFLIAYSR
jgi:hypothetical protein